MKKSVRKSWLIFVCIIAGIVIRVNGIGSMAAEMSSNQQIENEMVILVDVSESIEGYMDEIKKWAKKIGVYGRDTGITIAIYTFQGELSDSAVFQGMLGGDEEDLNDYKARIEDNINSAKGGFTDQLNVINTVIEKIYETNPDQEISGYKCIVMLSDGILALDNKPEISPDEEAAINQFRRKVMEFAGKEKQGVALIGFGNNTSMFEKIDGVLDYKVSDSEQNLSDENLILRKIYESMGILIEDVAVTDTDPNPASEGYKRVQFTLSKKYYKTLVNIECDEMTKDMAYKFAIREEGKKEAIIPDMVSVLEGACFLHYSYLEAKTYYVDIPENAKCDCERIDEVIVSNIGVSIEEDGKEVTDGDDGMYHLQANSEECKIKITIVPQSSEQVGELGNLVIKYYVEERKENSGENEGDTRQIYEYSGQGDWSKNIYYDTLSKQSLEEGKIYECWVTARQGNRINASDKIMIKVEVNEDNKDVTLSPSPEPDTGNIEEEEDNDCFIKRLWNDFLNWLNGR